MKTYRMLAGLLITVLLITSSSYAKEWSAIFSGGKGTRLDFNPQVGGLKINEDGSSYLYRFIVPETGMKATVILLFHGETGKTAASIM